MVHPEGIEPPTPRLQLGALPTELRMENCAGLSLLVTSFLLTFAAAVFQAATFVRMAGLAPAASRFRAELSASDLHPEIIHDTSWAVRDSNPRCSRCKRDILAAKLTAHKRKLSRIKRQTSPLIGQRGGTRTPEKRAPKARAMAAMRLAVLLSSTGCLFPVRPISTLFGERPGKRWAGAKVRMSAHTFFACNEA